MAIGEIVAGAIKGTADTGISIWQTIEQRKQAERNLALQQANLQWSKDMQREAWEREDNAVFRRVADLKRSGLSPVLAAGSAASSSSPVKTEAPQIDTSYIDKASGITRGLDAYLSVQERVAAIEQQQQTIAKTRAEQALIDSQQARIGMQTAIDKYTLDMMPLREQLLRHDISLRDAQRIQLVANEEYRRMQSEVAAYNLLASKQMRMRTTDSLNPFSVLFGGSKAAGDAISHFGRGLLDMIMPSPGPINATRGGGD